MRLKNKKTGEIKDVESLGHEKSLRDKYGPQITLSWDTEYENLGECRTYNSLAELNEEWEDYEEPKEYWWIDYGGRIKAMNDSDDEEDKARKQIGNYFETKEEAEKAVERLCAWKRLKDKGFRFDNWDLDADDEDVNVLLRSDKYKGNQVYVLEKDLDICFGGEE